jgi:hypothetical protein
LYCGRQYCRLLRLANPASLFRLNVRSLLE